MVHLIRKVSVHIPVTPVTPPAGPTPGALLVRDHQPGIVASNKEVLTIEAQGVAVQLYLGHDRLRYGAGERNLGSEALAHRYQDRLPDARGETDRHPILCHRRQLSAQKHVEVVPGRDQVRSLMFRGLVVHLERKCPLTVGDL